MQVFIVKNNIKLFCIGVALFIDKNVKLGIYFKYVYQAKINMHFLAQSENRALTRN